MLTVVIHTEKRLYSKLKFVCEHLAPPVNIDENELDTDFVAVFQHEYDLSFISSNPSKKVMKWR